MARPLPVVNGVAGKTQPARKPPRPKPLVVTEADADPLAWALFRFWVFWYERTDTVVLSPERYTAVMGRLGEGQTGRDVGRAIVGCNEIPHNRGENDRGRAFNDLELICRDTEHLDAYKSQCNEAELIDALKQFNSAPGHTGMARLIWEHGHAKDSGKTERAERPVESVHE